MTIKITRNRILMTHEAEGTNQSLSISHPHKSCFLSKLLIFFVIILHILALMWKMDKVRARHSKAVHRPLGLFFRICLSDVNPFCIDLILILRCHPSRCRETRALQVKGRLMSISKTCQMSTLNNTLSL